MHERRDRPMVIPTVDIAILKQKLEYPISGICKEKTYVLLIQKPDEIEKGIWRFPGGHADVTDSSYEYSALRELMEETGMVVNPDLINLGSTKINDPRYVDRKDKVITSFFAAKWISGEDGKGYDDVAVTKWFDVDDIFAGKVLQNPVHDPLFKRLKVFILTELSRLK